jgi:hypothetical protein
MFLFSEPRLRVEPFDKQYNVSSVQWKMIQWMCYLNHRKKLSSSAN